MDSIDICGTHCAYIKCIYSEIHFMQVTEEYGAKYFRWLNACTSEHIAAPYAISEHTLYLLLLTKDI